METLEQEGKEVLVSLTYLIYCQIAQKEILVLANFANYFLSKNPTSEIFDPHEVLVFVYFAQSCLYGTTQMAFEKHLLYLVLEMLEWKVWLPIGEPTRTFFPLDLP